jgi:integration host factor subunit beta
LDTLGNHLAKRGRIELRGFGSFALQTRPGRKGRNPRTGEAVDVPEKSIPRFKPGVELKARINR